jgi:hypothetical protein
MTDRKLPAGAMKYSGGAGVRDIRVTVDAARKIFF